MLYLIPIALLVVAVIITVVVVIAWMSLREFVRLPGK